MTTRQGSARKPNVIIVITDDQGYGDLGCTGNPWIRTPNIDTFHDESYRLTDFHVSPLCTPTRGAIMTAHRPVRNGAWATCWGRSILRKDETTLADAFAANGYRTGMFGKWHLGDNFPYRPQDRGFQHVVAHKGGGVGQTPDFWGNNYFDDTYFHNSRPVQHEGYCTDIWFEEATKFIRASEDRPFFAYIATNAPHSPFLVASEYRALYENNPDICHPGFYGMITNIDENFGKLRSVLEELRLADDTILVFMTDNGSDGGCRVDEDGHLTQGYNAGMRGRKGSYYDGGHRVPFFVRWPNGRLLGPHDIDDMVLHVDLFPTFAELCDLDLPEQLEFDGMSVADRLTSNANGLPDRTHFLQIRQSTQPPEPGVNAVMTPRWRLIGGSELYDIKADPGQQQDVASEHPEVVERLRAAHRDWWMQIGPGLEDYCPISLGHEAENPTRLDAMDVMGDVAWHQTHIVQAKKSTGRWRVRVERSGDYLFTLRRWPEELGLPIDAPVPPEDARSHIYADGSGRCETMAPDHARLVIFGHEHVLPVQAGNAEVTFRVSIEQTGETDLDTWFLAQGEDPQGAYYLTVQRL